MSNLSSSDTLEAAFDDVLNSLEGPKEDAVIRLVDKSVVPHNVRLHLAQEWGLFWYLGFEMYMVSPWNQISLPSDAAELFRNGDFIFVPTFKTYKETMAFVRDAESKGRLHTKLAPVFMERLNESGVYRYFFLPLSKKGRAIAHKLCQLGHLGEQTLEDRNCGIHPITGEVLPSRVQAYPIFKTYAHPASVCFSVWTTLQNRKLNLRDPDALARVSDPEILAACAPCLLSFFEGWGIGADPPKATIQQRMLETSFGTLQRRTQQSIQSTIHPSMAPSAVCDDYDVGERPSASRLHSLVGNWREEVQPVEYLEGRPRPRRDSKLLRLPRVIVNCLHPRQLATVAVAASDIVLERTRKIRKSPTF